MCVVLHQTVAGGKDMKKTDKEAEEEALEKISFQHGGHRG